MPSLIEKPTSEEEFVNDTIDFQNRKPNKTISITFWIIVISCFLIYIVASGDRSSQKERDATRLLNLENRIDSGYKLTDQEISDYCRLLNSVKQIYFDHCEKLVKLGGRLLEENQQKLGCFKREFLFPDKSAALNWGRILIGHNTKETFNDRGQLNGWETPNGNTVYWNHGDWITGLEKSKFPHLNYIVDNCKGHLFLKDKIKNAKLWEEFKEYFKL